MGKSSASIQSKGVCESFLILLGRVSCNARQRATGSRRQRLQARRTAQVESPPTLRFAALFAVALFALAPSADGAQPDDLALDSTRRPDPSSRTNPDPPARWHLPRKRAHDPLAHDDPPPNEPDWNPLAAPSRRLKSALRERGVVLDLDSAVYDQWASETVSGDENLDTFTWLATGDWRSDRHTGLGTSYIGWTLLGSPGLGYDTEDETLSGNVGSISGLNGNVVPDPAALDELFWKQVSPEEKWVLLAGRVDQSFYFDTNRIANNTYRQFFAFALENNLSIPWSTYGGLGLLLRFDARPDLYLMASASSTDTDEPWAPWKSLDENAWNQLLEVGVTLHIPRLGKGHYRLTPWHNRVSSEDGFGIAFNLDQELGLERLVGFFRYGIGDEDVTPVKRFLSGGFSLARPFGRKDDKVALGVAWSDPSPGDGERDETLVEVYYRLSLSPSLALTPDVQIVIDPADNDEEDMVVVLGVRLQLRL